MGCRLGGGEGERKRLTGEHQGPSFIMASSLLTRGGRSSNIWDVG
jgi:hypothetical protein